jgi:hypothetical protein
MVDPKSGLYFVTVDWAGRRVYDNLFMFRAKAFTIIDVDITTRQDNSGKVLLENIRATLYNGGDLPIYIRRLVGTIDGQPIWEENIGRWMVPGPLVWNWSWTSPGIDPGYHGFRIIVENATSELEHTGVSRNFP